MIVALLGLVLTMGLSTFWPQHVTEVTSLSGEHWMGEITDSERYVPDADMLSFLEPEVRASAEAALAASPDGRVRRRLFRTGNFDLSGSHFRWIDDYETAAEAQPEWAVVLERMAWGRFYGTPAAFLVDGDVVAEGPEASWAAFEREHEPSRARFDELREIEVFAVGDTHHRIEEARQALREVELTDGQDSDRYRAAQAEHDRVVAAAERDYATLDERRTALRAENDRYALRMATADGKTLDVTVADVVRGYPANQLGFVARVGVYLSRWWEFLWDRPREHNSEGGVFPAIFGTVIMTLIMSVLVVPFGVLAALYLREYAKQGWAVSAVRIAVNNLAGVPSIVFGVFGLGFFCYIVGGWIDESFYAANLPNPTFGKSGLLWASFTLALLTLPVVIVATEEALAAVPNSMREGSYACGATKWQTIRRIVLPRAAPGIMTGMILAIARGAGEVAPLMLVGAVKLVDKLPLDLRDWSGSLGPIPTGAMHLDRSFMHLGFHIFDLGFQSPNSEAAKPMVFTTTLLLIAIIVSLNLIAIWVRARLRRRFQGTHI
ncbi:MAG: phosphate ABC transporter permease PstA [Planctomycetes bacterium]|nr:phosphate ABC transporter permease PstA [Planctomycetota bacterium]